MNKEVVISLYYVALSCMADYGLKLDQTKELMELLINNDFSLVDKVKKLNITSDDLLNIVKELKKYSIKLNDTDKEIISSSLVNTFYSWIYHLSIACDKKLTYTERERENYQAILTEVKIELLLSYLKYGKNLKKEYKSFKSDFKQYGSNLGVISQLADEKDNNIKLCIDERIKDEKKLLAEYGDIFNITRSMLRTTFEQDIIEIKRNHRLKNIEKGVERVLA